MSARVRKDSRNARLSRFKHPGQIPATSAVRRAPDCVKLRGHAHPRKHRLSLGLTSRAAADSGAHHFSCFVPLAGFPRCAFVAISARASAIFHARFKPTSSARRLRAGQFDLRRTRAQSRVLMTLRGARFAHRPTNRLFIPPLGHNNGSLLALVTCARISRKHQAGRVSPPPSSWNERFAEVFRAAAWRKKGSGKSTWRSVARAFLVFPPFPSFFGCDGDALYKAA